MKGLRLTSLMMLMVLSLCLTSSVTQTFAQGGKDSTVQTPPSNSSGVNDEKQKIQILQAAVEYQTTRADAAEKRETDAIKQRDKAVQDGESWKKLYVDETAASQKLAASNLGLQIANKGYESNAKLDQDFIASQKRQIRTLKLEKFVYSGLSFGAGFGSGYLIGKNRKADGVSFAF